MTIVLIINLDERTDRLDHMRREMTRRELEFERVAAVKASEPEVIRAANMLPKNSSGRTISAGALAIFLSHRKCWERLVSSQDQYAMIFEDDILMADGISEYVSDFWVPRDADIVRLETFGTRVHVDSKQFEISIGSRHLTRLRSSHLGAACYVISRRAATYLLERTKSVSEAVDEALFNERSAFFKTLVIYQMVPAPAVQGDRHAKISKTEGLSWVSSSILERHAKSTDEPAKKERLLARIIRNFSAILISLRRKTKYRVIPYG